MQTISIEDAGALYAIQHGHATIETTNDGIQLLVEDCDKLIRNVFRIRNVPIEKWADMPDSYNCATFAQYLAMCEAYGIDVYMEEV